MPLGFNRSDAKILRTVGELGAVGLAFVAALAIGFWLGHLIDGWLGTSPWFSIIFFFFGLAAGVGVGRGGAAGARRTTSGRAGEVFHKVRYTGRRRGRDRGPLPSAARGGRRRRVLAGHRGRARSDPVSAKPSWTNLNTSSGSSRR